MALTLTPVRNAEDVWGRTKTTLFDITGDTSYPLTAGYVINAQDVGLKFFFSARVEGGNKAGGAVLPVFDFGTPAGVPATSAILRLFLPTGGATAPSTLTAPVAAAGAGTIVVTNGAITAGAITVTDGAVSIGAGGTPVTSTAANGAIGTQAQTTASAANPTQATSTAAFTGTTGGALTAGIGKEVGDTTNVSSLIYRVRFFDQ